PPRAVAPRVRAGAGACPEPRGTPPAHPAAAASRRYNRRPRAEGLGVWYAIEGHDGEGALERRREARGAHLARLQALRDEGRLLLAGPCPAIEIGRASCRARGGISAGGGTRH